MAELRTFSVLIAWDDNDGEQGNFGDIVRARDYTHAERIVRARMCWSHWGNHRWKGDSRRGSLSSYRNADGSYFGTVLDCHEGATWKAAELEKALRELLAEVDATAARTGWADNGQRENARKLIAEIDRL
jgi:hypothetical protein